MVAKSRAEIQKAYRERKKQENREEFLKKECERVKKLYVPSSQLSRKERIRRNARNNTNLKRHRHKLKAEKNVPTEEPMVVRLPFGKAKAGRKRVSRALSKKIKKIITLEETLKKLRTKHRSALRKIQRLRKQRKSVQVQDDQPSTPRSKTNAELSHLDKHQADSIRKQVLMSNVLLEEFKEAKESNKKKSTVLHKTLAGKIVKKYRCCSIVSRTTGLSRKTLSKASSKSFAQRREVRNRVISQYKEAVVTFLQRDDNSRNLPGKADKKRMEDGTTEQKRVLTDYISNLYDKFVSENPTAVISLTSFKRIRPANILPTAFISRSSCLCTKHQNAALLLKSVLPYIEVTKNPEDFIKQDMPQDEMIAELPDEMTYSEWKRVAIEEKGHKKMVTKIVEIKKAKTDFIEHFIKQFDLFKAHVDRMKTQYKEIRRLKEKLPMHHHVIHMDFAENYACRGLDEVQSAYWSQTQVTLHPTVIYSSNGEEPAQHSSYVYVSDDLNHNANTVITFVKDLIEKVKEIDPDVKAIHYWTDGPTSQYRNKTVFYLIANHKESFGIDAYWNFFEAGHGKGPCDGIGGVTKRSADIAMKSGRCSIQDASDFYAWSQSDACNLKSISFTYIDKAVCEENSVEISTWPAKPVKGTMKVHAVIGRGNSKLLVRDTSCYCEKCLAGEDMCPGWREESVTQERRQDNQDPQETPEEGVEAVQENTGQQQSHEDLAQVEVDDYVAATYENALYIGKVLEVDMQDEFCYRITFMEQKKAQYQWPRRPDILWCKKDDVKFHICQPLPSGKSKRLLKVSPEDREKIDKFEI